MDLSAVSTAPLHLSPDVQVVLPQRQVSAAGGTAVRIRIRSDLHGRGDHDRLQVPAPLPAPSQPEGVRMLPAGSAGSSGGSALGYCRHSKCRALQVSWAEYGRHLREVHGETHLCPACLTLVGKKHKKTIRHQQAHLLGRWPCELCQAVFPVPDKLGYHIRRYHRRYL